MKVLVCGGRDYDNFAKLAFVLDALHSETPITEVIHGDARGADRLGGFWADSLHIKETKYPANWAKHGKSAGPIRNAMMLKASRPDLIVACEGGNGTAHMVKIAKRQGYSILYADAFPGSY